MAEMAALVFTWADEKLACSSAISASTMADWAASRFSSELASCWVWYSNRDIIAPTSERAAASASIAVSMAEAALVALVAESTALEPTPRVVLVTSAMVTVITSVDASVPTR